MTIECRSTARMSNAAYFLNGTRKYPQGFTGSEAEQFVNACRTRFVDWERQALTSLRNALATL
jgi:DNA-binding SARP family transcriptional activator